MTRIPFHPAHGRPSRFAGRPVGRRTARLLLAGAFALALGAPAYAQTTTAVGGDLGSFIQNLIDLMNSNIIRGLAVLAVILTGIAWMFGHLDMRRAGTVVVGIIVIFGAATIVDLITGGAGA